MLNNSNNKIKDQIEQNETLELANNVLSLIKKEVTLSNDIIPRTACKLSRNEEERWNEEKKLIEKYGEKTFARFVEHNRYLDIVRQKAGNLSNKTTHSFKSTISVAITLLGVGEASELCIRGLVELIKAGCKRPINCMLVVGTVRTMTPRTIYDYHTHLFLIIGKTPKDWNKIASIDAFKKLSDDCILLDPSLNIIGKAKDTNKLLKNMFEKYQINRIATEQTYTCENPNDERIQKINQEILENAKKLSDKIKLELAKENIKLENNITYDETYTHVYYPRKADEYVVRLERIIGNDHRGIKLVNRDTFSGTKVSLQNFWLKQLPATSIKELSQELFCPEESLRLKM